jgi:hypothetical protein
MLAGVAAYVDANGAIKEDLIRSAIDEYLADRRFHDLRARVMPSPRGRRSSPNSERGPCASSFWTWTR